MNRNEAMSKVKKLLAMTTERGCTEDEAKTAAAMAARIMQEHAIEAAGLELESAVTEPEAPMGLWDDPLDSTPNVWKVRLALAVSQQMGCETINYRSHLKIAGRADNVQAVRYIYAYCAREVERLTRENAMGNGRAYVNAYRAGLIDAIRTAMRKEQESVRREAEERARQSANPNALVLVKNAIALATPSAHYDSTKTFLIGKGFRYRSGPGSSYGSSDRSARGRGRSDGAGIYRGGGSSKQIGRETRKLNG